MTLYENASNSSCIRTNEVYAFFNSNLKNGNEFFSIPERSPEYREFLVPQPASDEQIGAAARAALAATVR